MASRRRLARLSPEPRREGVELCESTATSDRSGPRRTVATSQRPRISPEARWLIAAFVTVLFAGPLAGCGDDGMPNVPDAGPQGPHARFSLASDPMTVGAIPWPDDLYLDTGGHVAVGELPGEATAPRPAYQAALRETLGALDGFGALGPIVFPFERGAVDPATLPDTVSASMREDANVFLMDADPASPEAFQPVPIEVRWDGERKRLALRPAAGHVLAPGRRYAAVVTRDVRGPDGTRVRAAPAFAAIRDATTRPTDPLAAEAYDEYAPILSTLASNGVPRQHVAALAVFRVQTIGRDLEDARARVREGEPPGAQLVQAVPAGERLDAVLGRPAEPRTGLDVEGGVRHEHIGWMIHGRFDAPSLLSRHDQVHGRFTRGDDGRLIVHGRHQVPFTLWVPRGADPATLRVILFQHALGGDRSQALAVADVLAEAGWAVLAIDAPFHGLRSPRTGVDTENRFTGQPEPDGFGDVSAERSLRDFVGIDDERGSLIDFHPVYLRDALRQGVVDLMMAVRLLRQGDWSEVHAAAPGLAELGFAEAPVGFVGPSLGGMIGTPFLAHEPEVGAALLSVTGGHWAQLLEQSPMLHRALLPPVLRALGRDPTAVDYESFPPSLSTRIGIWQMLVGRGDPLGHAGRLRSRPCHVLVQMARDDEVLHNVGTEALADRLGASILDAAPRHADLGRAMAPVRGNVDAGGEMVTRALSVYKPATHSLLLRRRGTARYPHPLSPPYGEGEPREVANPIDAATLQMVHFFETWRSGSPEAADPASL